MDVLPGGVGVFVECTSASFRTDDEPSAVWSLLAENGEEVLAESFRCPVFSIVLPAYAKAHLFDKRSVEQVQRAFIDIVVHVLDVCLQRPVDGLGPERHFAVLVEQSVRGPLSVHWPFPYGLGQDEGLVRPVD